MAYTLGHDFQSQIGFAFENWKNQLGPDNNSALARNRDDDLKSAPDEGWRVSYDALVKKLAKDTDYAKSEDASTLGAGKPDDADAILSASHQVELDNLTETTETQTGTFDIGPYASLDIFEPFLYSGEALALNLPPLGQYHQPPVSTNGTGHGEPPNSIPLPNLPSQPIATSDAPNWPLVNTPSSDLLQSTANVDSHQTIDSEVGIAISPPEHWYHRYQRGQCVSTGTTFPGTLIGTTSQGTSLDQSPQPTGPWALSVPAHDNANGYATGSPQSSTNAFSAFLQAPATIMNLTDFLFILALIFQSTSSTLYFTRSPTSKSGHYTDPDFQSLCSTFCKETFTLLVLLFGISRLKERFLKPWIVVVGLLSFVLSVTSLGVYFVYTSLGDSLMCLAGLLQVVVWRLVVLRWRDEDGRVSGVSTPSTN